MYSIFTPHTDVQCAALLEGAVLTSATERLELLATKLGCCAELLLAVSLEEALEMLQATAHDHTHHIAVVRCEVLLPPKELPLPDAPLPTSLLTPVAAAVRRRPNTIGLLSDDGGDDIGMAPLEAVFDVDSPTSGSSPQSPVVHLPPQPTPTRISPSRDLVRQPHYFIISWGLEYSQGQQAAITDSAMSWEEKLLHFSDPSRAMRWLQETHPRIFFERGQSIMKMLETALPAVPPLLFNLSEFTWEPLDLSLPVVLWGISNAAKTTFALAHFKVSALRAVTPCCRLTH